MERFAADEVMASEVAVADLPSTSGAHWANRDVRRTGGQESPFRRPPALRSFEAPEESSSPVDSRDDVPWDAFAAQGHAVEQMRPEDTGSMSRASFGVTDGPISGNWFGRDPSPISPAGAPGHAYPHPADMPLAVELPVRGADGLPTPPVHDWPVASYRESPETGYSETGYAQTGYAQTGYQAVEQDAHSFFDQQPGREIRPHRADHQSGGRQAHHQAEPRRRSRLLTAATVTLSTLVLVGATLAGVAYFAGEDKDIKSVLELGSGDQEGGVATAPLDGRSTATFELVAATRRATVKTQDLGGDLFKITADGEAGMAPRPSLSGDKVQLLLSTDSDSEKGDGARGNVEVLLSSKVTWALRFTGGADEQMVDLTGGKISSVDLTGASRRVDLTLPTPSGTVPLRVTGAIEDLSLTSPKGSPVRVQVDSGAKTVAAGTRTLRDVKPGSTLTPKDWKVANRYDVEAESRLTLLTVRNVG